MVGTAWLVVQPDEGGAAGQDCGTEEGGDHGGDGSRRRAGNRSRRSSARRGDGIGSGVGVQPGEVASPDGDQLPPVSRRDRQARSGAGHGPRPRECRHQRRRLKSRGGVSGPARTAARHLNNPSDRQPSLPLRANGARAEVDEATAGGGLMLLVFWRAACPPGSLRPPPPQRLHASTASTSTPATRSRHSSA